MKKFRELVLLTLIALCLIPASAVFADNGGFSNSVQVLGYGYNSSGEHYTNYTERYQKTASSTYAEGYGMNVGMSYGPGETARSSIKSPENVYHTHLYKGVSN